MFLERQTRLMSENYTESSSHRKFKPDILCSMMEHSQRSTQIWNRDNVTCLNKMYTSHNTTINYTHSWTVSVQIQTVNSKNSKKINEKKYFEMVQANPFMSIHL